MFNMLHFDCPTVLNGAMDPDEKWIRALEMRIWREWVG